MRIRLIVPTALAAALLVPAAHAQTLTAVELGLSGGYQSGLSGEAFVHAPGLIGPLGVKLGVSYSRSGDPINDSADLSGGAGLFTLNSLRGVYGAGNVPESGSYTVVSLDGTYGLGELAPGIDATLYAGPRYGLFRGGYSVSGTQAYTTYSSNAFGIGGGVMLGYALTGNISLYGDVGADYFFPATIYRSTRDVAGGTQNDTYTTSTAGYSTESAAFNRPGTSFKAKIGVKYTF